MRRVEAAVTPNSDIAVELVDVWKAYRQRQRPESFGESVRGLLHPAYKTVQALRGANLEIRYGEIVAYAGPNGAGKSTTIKLLSGLMIPDTGSVRALGMDPARNRVRYVGRIAVVFGQRTELWWDHSVGASFRWKKATWDIPDQVYNEVLAQLWEQFELAPLWKTLARELSLGQRMRADLALALLHDPELILLDEPTLGLDVIARDRMLDWIKHINATMGKTILITSHSMADLERLASRVVIVHNGSISFDGGFSDLRASVTDRRALVVSTDADVPHELPDATLVSSAGGRHEYVFDASKVSVVDLLSQLSESCRIFDVQTSAVGIDQVVTEAYQRMGAIADRDQQEVGK